MESIWLTQALVFLAAAVLVVPLFQRAGQGSVLGYVAAGVLIGPIIGLTGSESTDILHFAELGVVLLLFVIGLELQPARLWTLRRSIFVMGGLQVGITATLLSVVAISLGLSLTTAIVVGLGLSLSSTAAALETLTEKHELATHHGRSATAILLFQDLMVIPIVAIIGRDTADQQDSWLTTAIAVIVLACVIVGGRYLLRPFFRYVASTHNQGMLTAAALLVVLGTGALMQLVGLSMALGAFVAGVLLADSEYRHELESRIEPFKGVLIGLFFLALGMSFDLHLMLADPAIVVALVVGLMMIKFGVLFVLGRYDEHTNEAAMKLGSKLSQGGEFAFVIFSLAVATQLMAPGIAGILTVVVVLSMAATPPLSALNRLLWRRRKGQHEDPGSGKLRLFVSYSRSNAGPATRLVQLLEAEDFEITIDTRDLPFGEEWQAELDYYIRQADTVIWLISPASVQSTWCRWELDKVRAYRKRLVPIMLEEVPPSDLPDAIGRIQVLPQAGVLDLTDAAQMRLLTDTLRANQGWLKEHTRLAERARLWASAKRSADRLLRGAELAAAESWRDEQPQSAPDPGTAVLDLIHSSRIAEPTP